VAVWVPGSAPVYAAWGHDSDNNCTRTHAHNLLSTVWADPRPKLFHNGEFDMEVAQHEFGLPWLPIDQWHDSMLTAYLHDPHDVNYQLKSLAERHLGEPPTERDELRDWVLANVPGAKQAKTQWGKHIARAPGGLVGAYAIGDCTRTRALFEHDYPFLAEMGMLPAYDRERRILPILVQNSQQGVKVDIRALERDAPINQTGGYYKVLEACNTAIRTRLRCKDLNIDSNEDLANAIDKRGWAKNGWLLTEKGARSVSKESLEVSLTDAPLRAMLGYRQALSTCLNTFLTPWLIAAYRNGGTVPVNWNSTRQDQRGRGGTRTGRLSSTPNFQNIFKQENLDKVYKVIQALGLGWPPLPQVRGYIIADSKDHVILDRDYNQQELRILAHYEDGDMAAAYRADPKLDLHTYAAKLILDTTGVVFDPDPVLARKITKETAFGLIYGMGVAALAERLERSVDEAKTVKDAYLGTFPGVDTLMEQLKKAGKNGEPIHTWGGRVYYAEAPRMIQGRMRDFAYKLINYLIQGSAADCTKEAIIRYDSVKREGRFLMTVHDQNLVCAPRKAAKQEMKLLREAMESVEFDVPMLTTGDIGERWLNMTKEDEWSPKP
jgi:DNA polymerase I-like protein with 3'-5' exonuclease and polymerase domains